MNESEHALIEEALRLRSHDAIFRHLAPLRPRIVEDRDVAETWLTLLEAAPTVASLVDDVKQTLAAFPSDATLLVLGLRALLRADERRGPDEPALESAPAREVIALGEPRLEDEPSKELSIEQRAAVLAMLGNAHRRLGAKHDAKAIEHLEESIKLAPEGSTFFDLGLCHKWAGRFRAAAIAFERAEEKLGASRAILFNHATVATASGEVERAAEVWRQLGFTVELEKGALPLVKKENGELLDEVFVRVPTRGMGRTSAVGGGGVPNASVVLEVIGVAPLSPCHGVVRTPTAREAIVDFGDVILFDPAPVMRVEREGALRPVMPLLRPIHKGDERRFPFLGMEQEAGDIARLGDVLPEGCVFYLHDTRVDRICPRCAAGLALEPHEHVETMERRVVRGKLVCPRKVSLHAVKAAIEEAKKSDVLFAIPTLYEAVGDTAAAGKQRKSWGDIEHELTMV